MAKWMNAKQSRRISRIQEDLTHLIVRARRLNDEDCVYDGVQLVHLDFQHVGVEP